MEKDCIFCKIAAGEIPCAKVLENDKVLAFLDIAPVSLGHVLVITKEHYANLETVPEAELIEAIKAVKKIGQALKIGLNVAGYNIVENNDPVAGQVINHLHFHIIPRAVNDGLKVWPQGKYRDGEINDMAEVIKQAL
ncbi:MAG: HIT family protein [Candidatus Buchananbacteria bacterium]